jgi:hypothetical protein
MEKKGALIVEPGKYFYSGIFIFPDVSARRRGQLSKTPASLSFPKEPTSTAINL